MTLQYYSDRIDVCKATVSISGISMTYVLNKFWRDTRNLSHMHQETFVTHHKIKKDEFQNCCCNDALKCDVYCVQCQLDQALQKYEYEKKSVYELLKTGIMGEPVQVFTRYHEKDITRIRSHVYGEENKLTKSILGYIMQHLHRSGGAMRCDKGTLLVNEKPSNQR